MAKDQCAKLSPVVATTTELPSILPVTDDMEVSSNAVPLTNDTWFNAVLLDGSVIVSVGGMTSAGVVALRIDVPELFECVASPPYVASMVTAPPDDEDVYFMLHVALFSDPDRRQEPELSKLPPAPLSFHDTLFAGVDAGVALSVTVTSYCMVSPAPTDDGFGVTTVVVQSTGWFCVI